MKTKQGVMIYLIGAMVQMGIVCSMIAILRLYKVNYNGFISLIFLAIGGLSTAIWGSLVAKWTGKIKSYKELVKAFLKLRVPWKYYLIVMMFLCIVFGKQLIGGELVQGTKWYDFLFLFVSSIIFGGIEEIGWRYTYQPLLEEKMPYEMASVCTFISWGVWHYMYFYMTDTLGAINHASFLVGLLASCFILGAIYRITKSLWLCVLYHVMLNVFSQTLVEASLRQALITTLVCIVGSIILVRKNKDLIFH